MAAPGGTLIIRKSDSVAAIQIILHFKNYSYMKRGILYLMALNIMMNGSLQEARIKIISRYGMTNIHEDIAETIVAWVNEM